MIPLIDLPAQYDSIREDIDAAVTRVLHSGRYVLGPEVEAFEKEFADFCHADHAVGVNSGTSALYLSLVAAGVGPGDEVITVPFTFEATVAAIRSAGASVRFVDVNRRSLTMDTVGLEQQVTEHTKAIIPVHLYGQAADMDPIRDVANRHGLTVIEDACQAHGATYNGHPVGSLGDLACFSFYPSKNLSTCGEGGIIVTDDESLAATARHLRSWGPVARSGNHRLSAIAAAILRVKLPHLPDWTTRRQAVAARYTALLSGDAVEPPTVMSYGEHVFNVYALRSVHRDSLARTLRASGVEVGIHYQQPIHLQVNYRCLGHTSGAFPVSERAAQEELSLPIYPELSERAVTEIAETIQRKMSATGGSGA